MKAIRLQIFGLLALLALLVVGCSPVGTMTPMFTPGPSDIPPDATEVKGTAFPPGLHVIVNGCDTSVDVRHGMGEVTNVYVYLSNAGASDIQNLTLTASANDEEGVHPDKTAALANLPAGFEVTSKLTMDTVFNTQTVVEIVVTVQGEKVYMLKENCKEIAQDARERISAILGRLRKIQ